MKTIELNKGMVALVDDSDFEALSEYRWRVQEACGLRYAVRSVVVAPKKKRLVFMHRVIANAPQGKQVDHLDGNGLDNRRFNLRVVGNSENQQNRKRLSQNTSGYRGVTCIVKWNKWQAAIKRHQKTYHLGWHDTAEQAARAYDAKALELYGEDAAINFT